MKQKNLKISLPFYPPPPPKNVLNDGRPVGLHVCHKILQGREGSIQYLELGMELLVSLSGV